MVNFKFLLLFSLFIYSSFASAQENVEQRRLLLSQFAVFKIEEFPYFSNDVMTLFLALPIVDCTLGKKSMIKKWFPTILKIDSWPKKEKEIGELIHHQDMGELLFLGKVLRYESEQSFNFKMLPEEENKFNDCFAKNKLEVVLGQNRQNYKNDLMKYSKSLISFHYFINEHYQKILGTGEKTDMGRSIQTILDSIAKKYSHDVYKF